MRARLLLALTFAVGACSPAATDDMPAATTGTGRIKVERVGVISDGLAYGDRRGLYVITDTTTGAEFIGVSGVGIVETGSHQVGKTRTRDER